MEQSAANYGWYRDSYRRMLVDMHIPDWDAAFLAKYNPQDLIALYQRARLSSVMFYCQSHVGLCYWPTRSGLMHAGLRGREHVPARTLSQGQRRRAALARLPLGQARLWILDEPFNALDTAANTWLLGLIEGHLQRGGLAVLTSHQPVALAPTVVQQELTL